MNRRLTFWGLVLAACLLAWVGVRAYRASKNLVTLDVHNMPVRDVVKKIERQVWERIVVHNDVKGNVTLVVNKVPLEEVLNIVGEQTSARWTALYPLYSKGASLAAFKKITRGELPVENSGWTNFQARGFGRGGRGDRGGPGGGPGGFGGGPGGFGGPGGPGGMFGENAGSLSAVTLHVAGRDLDFALLALGRYGQAHVVPENGSAGTINIQVEHVPMEKVVATIAKQVRRKWDQFYTLQPGPEFGFFRDRGRDDRSGETNRFDRGRFSEERRGPPEDRREEFRAMRERQSEAMLATMTPEEQKQAQEQRQQVEEIRNLPPEQREQRFQEMASRPEVQQRFENRMNSALKNSTPEQRLERAQRRLEMRKQREQQQGRR